MKNEKRLKTIISKLGKNVESIEVEKDTTMVNFNTSAIEIIKHKTKNPKPVQVSLADKTKTIEDMQETIDNLETVCETYNIQFKEKAQEILFSNKVVDLVAMLTQNVFCNSSLNRVTLTDLVDLLYQRNSLLTAFGPEFMVTFNHENKYLYITYDENPATPIYICINEVISIEAEEPKSFDDLETDVVLVPTIGVDCAKVFDSLGNLLDQYVKIFPLEVLSVYVENKESFKLTPITSGEYKFLVNTGKSLTCVSFAKVTEEGYQVLSKIKTLPFKYQHVAHDDVIIVIRS